MDSRMRSAKKGLIFYKEQKACNLYVFVYQTAMVLRFYSCDCWWLVLNDFCRTAMREGKIQLKSDGSPQRFYSCEGYRQSS